MLLIVWFICLSCLIWWIGVLRFQRKRFYELLSVSNHSQNKGGYWFAAESDIVKPHTAVLDRYINMFNITLRRQRIPLLLFSTGCWNCVSFSSILYPLLLLVLNQQYAICNGFSIMFATRRILQIDQILYTHIGVLRKTYPPTVACSPFTPSNMTIIFVL